MSEMQPESDRYRADDEIDLRELLQSIWDTRIPVVVSVLFFSGLFWLAVIVLSARDGISYTWDTRIHFIFDGAEDGRYPDSSAFASTDLLSSVILQRVYELNELDQHGLSRSAFSNALAVTSYAPTREFIVRRYRSQLDRRDLTSAEIGQLEQEFSHALERASRGQATLSLTLREGLRPGSNVISDELARKVLLDIPRVWARYMTEEAGVFASDLRLYSAEVIDPSMFAIMDDLIATDLLQNQFQMLNSNLEALGGLANSGSVRDPESGMRLGDIRARADWLENFVLEDLRASALGVSVSDSPEMTWRFFQGRIEEQRRRKSLLEARADRIDQALSAYLASADRTNSDLALVLPDDGLGGQSVSALTGEMIDRLVQLGTDSSDVQFRQGLTRERLNYLLEASELQVEIERLEQMVGLIESADEAGGADRGLADELAVERSQRLQALTESLQELFAASERIAGTLNELRYGAQGPAYNIVRVPGSATVPPMVLTRGNLQGFALGAVLVGLIALILTLLINLMRNRRSDSTGSRASTAS